MKLTKSELHIANCVRRAYRWRIVSAWVLGMASLAFSFYGLFAIILLRSHLHEHGARLAEVLAVLWEAEQPGHIRISVVFSLGTLIVLFLALALECALGVAVILHKGKEQKLLLKLLGDEDRRDGNRDFTDIGEVGKED